MEELHKIIKKKYKDFDITPQHLGQVIRDNNITRKKTRHEHYPKERYGKPTDIKKELKAFYKKVLKYDELSIEIKNAIKQVKKNKYKNYFVNAYNKDTEENIKVEKTKKEKIKKVVQKKVNKSVKVDALTKS